MTDPFSITGGVVSILSLAITTVQGVKSYYESWNTQDQYVSDVNNKVQSLLHSLSALEQILPRISSSSATKVHVEQCVLSSKEGISRLEEFLRKCRKNPAPVGLKDKVRTARQKAIFPFRRSSLDTLRDIVRDLEGNLGTALQVLHL